MNHYSIQKSDANRAAETLHQAFRDDPLLLWIFGGQSEYDIKGKALLLTWVNYCILYGITYRTENFEAIALRRQPKDFDISLWRLFRSGMLKTPSILGNDAFDRLMIVDKLSKAVKKQYMKDKKFIYCWNIGTLPGHRGQGYGSSLMQATFDYAKQNNLPCYLEVASEKSKQIHLGKGYKVVTDFELPNSSVKVTAMIR